ncbi:Lysophosphatidylcholine acyltransferase 2 [Perkinsus olseni]|uniref:holo-[acyl-carrier-protein] synthase n=1 Tax=Perkinsus olseni TaxID=32597 RepID=A0A7J6MNE4_PEROL|nr:Lysophosphatidylcholine acyltransferase 2 [Perkinsus olseni]KAF4673108.1 Lysophosphatidylcholine acyltransferase 2 [Perkinsus olseni]
MMASLRSDVHYVDVHDWTQNVSDPSITDLRRAKLPDTEVENRKVDQYLQEEDKRMCLVSRLLPRYLVNKATAVPFREVSVMNRERRQQGMFKPVYGPPYTKPLDPSKCVWEAYPSFSISHDNGMVAMAVHPLYGVGVDIQCLALPRIYTSARQFIDEMRGDVLSEDEYGFIDSHTADEDRLREFYRIWTAKESYQKCVGLGFALPMTELEVDQSGDISRLEDGKWASQRSGFRLKSFTLKRCDGTEFVGCICVGELSACDPSWTCYRPKEWPSPSMGQGDIVISLRPVSVSENLLTPSDA